MFGFSPRTSPPQRRLRSSVDSACSSMSPLSTISPRAVSSHSRRAKSGSSTWKRSFTRTASPRFGLPGVVTSGSVRRKAMYFSHNLAGHRLDTVTICSGWRDTADNCDESSSGVKAGQCGLVWSAVAFRAGLAVTDALDFVFVGISEVRTMLSVRRKVRCLEDGASTQDRALQLLAARRIEQQDCTNLSFFATTLYGRRSV